MKDFNGFIRPDGSVGIRNHVLVIPSVSCANGVVGLIARMVPEAVPIYHGHGCGRAGKDMEWHMRTLVNLGKNPNAAAVLVIGLGCEVIKGEFLAQGIASSGKPVELLNIQEQGGSLKTAARGAEIIRRFLDDAAREVRQPAPFSSLTLGLECGGSDAFSGVTANPSVGRVADWVVDQGGTVILTETTEMIGTSHILERRACDSQVAAQVAAMIAQAEKRTHELLGPLASVVIAPGNMDGGMSSIREKSLGCIIKGGSRVINQVIDYAEIPSQKGLILMDGPGYDTESMAGVAAAGSQIMIFTTGRGNPIGFPMVPVIKVASTTQMFTRMEDDMDINAGAILQGRSLEQVASDIRELLIKVAGGDLTKAERNQQTGILCMSTNLGAF